MANMDPISGTPFFNIKTEGQEIQIRIDKTSPTTGRISWTIPNPPTGCTTDSQSYNGIVITLDNTPITRAKEPKNGVVYSADPNADTNLHTGDRLDTALVVGAFYGDKTTTYVDISGMLLNGSYYVSGFAVDNVNRYHTSGVHTYALPYGNDPEPDLNGFQVVKNGVQGTDFTGLAAATNYTFTIATDGGTPVTITVNGTNASTYDDLINEINKQIALIGGPSQSGSIPNLNAFYWDVDTQKLYKWNGSHHILVDVLVEPSDPSLPVLNDYWYENDTDTVYKWDGLAWVVQSVIKYKKDPTNLGCDDYWFNGINAYRWDGDVWCKKVLYNQAINPSLPPTMTCPTYWYDTANSFLYEWSFENTEWNHLSPIVWPTDPTAIANGTYWFDLTTNELKIRNSPNWDVVVAFIQTTQPTAPADGALWFNTDTDVLKQYSSVGNIWNVVAAVVWEKDPIIPTSCDTWWNTTLDQVNVWDILTNTWVVSSNFIQTTIDPSLPPVLVIDTLWFNTVNNKLYSWDGTQFVSVSFINYPTQPVIPSVGVVWENTITHIFSVWTPTWVAIDPKLFPTNPYAPVSGDFWYDTINDVLNRYNGISWVSILYSTTSYTPIVGSKYFDIGTQTLMEWDGVSWVASVLPVVVSIDADGNLRFDSVTLGSVSYVDLVDVTLFAALSPTSTIQISVRGIDGASDVPSYREEGVGTDGSDDERREIMEFIRAKLGGSFVDVELSKNDLSITIDLALETLRQKSSIGVRKQYFFITLTKNNQVYKLTDKRVGLNKIVNIMAIHRARAALNGSNSIWDQAFIQQLYRQGAYDLSSYAFMNEYIETLEQLFAVGMQFRWREDSRELIIEQNIGRSERVILETMAERSEQDLFKDRTTRPWIKRWALAEAKEILAQVRGKFASLPGAGAGISLNASDLANEAATMKQELLQEIDDYVVNSLEDVGMHGSMLIG